MAYTKSIKNRDQSIFDRIIYRVRIAVEVLRGNDHFINIRINQQEYENLVNGKEFNMKCSCIRMNPYLMAKVFKEISKAMDKVNNDDFLSKPSLER